MSKPYLVIGATRGTGLAIANRLLEAGRPVRVLVRDLVKARTVFGTNAEIVRGDLSAPDEVFTSAFRGVEHIVYTAAFPFGPATEDQIRAVDYDGLIATIKAAKLYGFTGRFLYMSPIGITQRSVSSTVLDVLRRGSRRWRREAEEALRGSGLRLTIIRVGALNNDTRGKHPITIKSGDMPFRMHYRISREDAAECFLQALQCNSTENKEMSIYWTKHEVQPIERQLLQV